MENERLPRKETRQPLRNHLNEAAHRHLVQARARAQTEAQKASAVETMAEAQDWVPDDTPVVARAHAEEQSYYAAHPLTVDIPCDRHLDCRLAAAE
jgi:hypothetical protein